MPRILFCAPDFPPARGGGPALFAALARRWADAGGDSMVYASGPAAGEDNPFPAVRVRRFRRRPPVTAATARVRGLAARVGSTSWRAAVGFPYQRLEGYHGFLRGPAHDRDGPFALVVHGYLPHVHVMEPAARFAARHSIPHVAVPLLHSGLLGRHPDRHVLGDGAAAVLRRARRVVALTRAELDPLRHLGVASDRLLVIGAAINVETLTTPDVSGFTRRHELDGDWLVQAGGLSADKGTTTVLAAHAMRRQGGARETLVLAGRPEPEVRSALAELPASVAATVRLVEAPTDADMHAAIAGAVAMVHPSRAESFGLLVLEAWSHGVPVIVGRSGGAAHLVRDGIDGRVVPVDKPRALAAAVDDLVARPEHTARLVAEGRRRVREELTWDQVFPRWLQVLQEALGP